MKHKKLIQSKSILILCLLVSSVINKIYAQEPYFGWASASTTALNNNTDVISGERVAVDARGNVYTIGYFTGKVDFNPNSATFYLTTQGGSSDMDIFIQKLDANGNFVWAKRLGGPTGDDYGYDIAVDANGFLYCTGSYSTTVDFDPGPDSSILTSVGGSSDIFVQKLDTNGNFVWVKSIGGTYSDQGYGIAVDISGNVYTTGDFGDTVDFDPGFNTSKLISVGGSYDIFVQKLDANGNFVWAKGMGGTYPDRGRDITLDASSNVYITGSYGYTVDFDPGSGISNLTSMGGSDAFIQKLSASGNFVWAKSMGGSNTDIGNAIAVDASGNVYATGDFRGSVDFDPGIGTNNLVAIGLSDIYIQKLDATGNFLWAKNMGGTNTDHGYGVAVDNNGNIFTTGSFYGSVDFDPGTGINNLVSNGTDVFIQKLDIGGNFVWAKNIGGSNVDFGSGITSSDNGSIYITGMYSLLTDLNPTTGSYYSTGNDYGIFTIKLLSTCAIDTTIINTSICQGQSYFFNGGSKILQGTYIDTLMNRVGCDSIVILNLTVKALPIVSISPAIAEICKGQSTTLTASGGGTYTWSNSGGSLASATYSPTINTSYNVTVTDSNTCSASASRLVTVKQTTATQVNQTICSGQSIVFNGSVLKQSGTYKDTLVNAVGCDSVISLILTVSPPIQATLNKSICFGSSYFFKGQALSQAGTYKDTTSTLAGCDSITTLVLVIRSQIITNQSKVLCNGGSILINGQTITQAGAYRDTLVAFNGCDSIIVLNITVAQSSSNTISQSACGSYIFNGQTLTQSGSYRDTLVNAAGCDSFITCNLTIKHATASSLFDTICNGDSYSFGSQMVSQSGTYNRTITNAVGCDSVITLKLFVRPSLAVTASASGLYLTATPGYVSYQWKLNGNAIAGATTANYTAVANGSYWVELTDADGCKGNSNTVNVTSVGVGNISNISLSIYPNPAEDLITIKTDQKVLAVELYNVYGQKIDAQVNNEQQINVRDLSAGTYSIVIHTKIGSVQKRFVKNL